MFQNDRTKKPQFSDAGDPYGNRTRVSAVEPKNPLISTLFPDFRGLFMVPDFAGLRAVGKNGRRRSDRVHGRGSRVRLGALSIGLRVVAKGSL